jgi:nucleoid-associated protein YgaU
MKKQYILVISSLLLVITLGAFAQQYSYDYKNMKMDEYNVELSKWQKREADAKSAIAEIESKIAEMEAKISEAQAQKEQCWAGIYDMLGTDKAGYDAFVAKCKALENDLSGFANLSPQDIYARQDELEGYKNRLAELRKNKISAGPEPHVILSRCESLLQQAQNKLNSVGSKRYTVVRGDYLWKIAKRPDTYNDPYAWMRIYTANKAQIKNPDLIYPNQVFELPLLRKPGEHWVARGESLSSIAKSMGNAFNWQRIYEANKDVIGEDPSRIYPHMILRLP